MLIAGIANAIAGYPVTEPVMLIGAVCVGIASALGDALGSERVRNEYEEAGR